MALARYFMLSLTLTLVGCDKMLPEEKVEDNELVSPEEKKALEKFGDRLPET
jgi:hypothetical protein